MEKSEGHSNVRFDFSGRRVVITGASRGIGRALASRFAQCGADLVLTARGADALAETAADLRQFGNSVECLSVDQRDVAQVRATMAELSPVDVLINNAGIEEVCPSLDIEEALWDRIVDTNLKGAFFVAQAIAAGMAARKSGVIVNLASLTSFVGVPTAAPYGASKSGVLGLTRALAAEWAPLGVRVNAIAPGYFETGMTSQFYEDPDWVARMTAKVPIGRLGNLEDLVGTVMFLASDASAYIAGQCIVVDGGYLSTI